MMSNIDEVLNLYHQEKYDMCLKIFHDEFSSTIKHMKKNDTLALQLENVDDITIEAICQNNALICEAIAYKSRLDNNSNWINFMNSLIQLYARNRSLCVIPVELELSFVSNILWWFCMIPKSSQDKSLFSNKVHCSVSRCMIKVLRLCNEPVMGHSDDNPIPVLRLVTDQLLRLSSVACVQLLNILTLTIIALEDSLRADILPMVRSTAEQLDLLRLHAQRKSVSGIEELYFKFGFTRINSSASLKSSGEIVDTFAIVGSVGFAINGEFNVALGFLKRIQEEDTSFMFLLNYLKAYYCMHCEQHNEAHLYLAYAAGSSLPPRRAAHHRLLLARLLNETGDSRAALAHCEQALATAPRQANQLAAAISHKMNLSTAHLTYLKQLVQCLKEQTQEGECSGEGGFEECCLSLLTRHQTVSLAEASYSLARELYLAGYHIKALDAYQELVQLLGASTSPPRSLPSTLQILHETALSHLKTNSLQEGEQLCRRLISEYTPAEGGGKGGGTAAAEGRWERALCTLEEDALSMILLADILLSDKRKAVEQLNRCYNVVVEGREQATGDQLELFDWLLCRILLRKAQISGPAETPHYFRRALMHKPGDKVVVYHYKQWSLWHPDHQSFDPGDQVIVFPDDEAANLALRHVLGCSVSQEEWDALCDPHSSLQLLDTLFDND